MRADEAMSSTDPLPPRHNGEDETGTPVRLLSTRDRTSADVLGGRLMTRSELVDLTGQASVGPRVPISAAICPAYKP